MCIRDRENGVQIPLALCEFNQAQFYANNPIASAFDVSIKDFDLDDEGNVHYSRTQDGYKEFLTNRPLFHSGIRPYIILSPSKIAHSLLFLFMIYPPAYLYFSFSFRYRCV